MAGLTTHVLDTSIGKPAYKILIELYSFDNNYKNKILECFTNKDGRVDNPLISNENFVKGKKKADNINAWIVPGSKQVEAQAQEEGLLAILEAAGFELRQPGCSACLAMNDDKIPAGKYAVSTSNRNFEGRQGPGARTLLASPLVAAACAVSGKITDPREYLN